MMIKQRTLQDILDRREHVAALKRGAEAAARDLDALEAEVIALIDAGAPHERGPLAAGIDADSVRRPKWKEAFVQTCGEAVAARVVAETPATVHRRLIVLNTATRKV